MAQRKVAYAPRHLRAEHEASRGKPAARETAVRTAAKRGVTARKRRAAAAERQSTMNGASETSELFYQTLLPMVENVHRLDQASLRVGVTWLLLLPVLLLIIRRLTGSSKVTFLIIWVVGMFIISAALILIGYADHELKRFLEEVKRYEPAAAGTTLGSVLNRDSSDAYALPLAPDILLGTVRRIRRRLSESRSSEQSSDKNADEDSEQLLVVEEWLHRIAQGRGKEAENAEYPSDHSR